MSQNGIIAGILLVAFLVFITMRGELSAYLALFSAQPGAASSAATGASIPTIPAIPAIANIPAWGTPAVP